MPTETPQVRAASGRKWLVVSVLAALLFQVIIFLRSPAIARDGINFINLARALKCTPVATMRTEDQHPGYPAMILAGRWLVSGFVPPESIFSWIWGARLVSGTFGLLTIVILWVLTRRTFDETTAAIAVIIVTVLPLFRENASDVLSDTPHLFFYVLAVWLSVEGMIRRGWLWFLGAGAASGAAYWIRPEGLSVMMVAAAVLPFWAWWYRGMRPLKVLLCMAVLVVSAVVVSTPYQVLSGKFSSKITNKEYLLSAVPGARGKQTSTSVRTIGLRSRMAPPKKNVTPAPPRTSTGTKQKNRDEAVLRITWGALVELGRETAHSLRWVLLLPLVVGVLVPAGRRAHPAPRLLIGSVVAFRVLLLVWLYYAGRYISHRHIMPPLLVICPWVASGAVLMAQGLTSVLWRRDPGRARQRRGLVTAILVVTLVAGLMPRTLRQVRPSEIPVIKAAILLGETHARPGDRVLTNSFHVPFYAQMPGRLIGLSEVQAGIDLSRFGSSHRFVVLTLDWEYFRKEWLSQVEPRYGPLDLPGISKHNVRAFVLREDAPGGR